MQFTSVILVLNSSFIIFAELQRTLLVDLPGFHKYFLHEAPTHIPNHGLTMACQSIGLEINDTHISARTACHPPVRVHRLSILKTPMYLKYAQSDKHVHMQKGKSDLR